MSLIRPLRRLALICALPAMLTTPALAGPTVGVGVTFTFGASGVDTGVGLRVFSNNRRNSTVASVGVDYMFGNQTWRGTLGAARLGRNSYVGLDLGIGLGDGAIDFGVGVGAANTRRAPAPAAPPAPDPDPPA